jgi:hypothetical protein
MVKSNLIQFNNFEVDNVFFFNFKTQKKKEKKINAKSQDGVSTFYTLIGRR